MVDFDKIRLGGRKLPEYMRPVVEKYGVSAFCSTLVNEKGEIVFHSLRNIPHEH